MSFEYHTTTVGFQLLGAGAHDNIILTAAAASSTSRPTGFHFSSGRLLLRAARYRCAYSVYGSFVFVNNPLAAARRLADTEEIIAVVVVVIVEWNAIYRERAGARAKQ